LGHLPNGLKKIQAKFFLTILFCIFFLLINNEAQKNVEIKEVSFKNYL